MTNRILIVGGSGLVGFAALKLFHAPRLGRARSVAAPSARIVQRAFHPCRLDERERLRWACRSAGQADACRLHRATRKTRTHSGVSGREAQIRANDRMLRNLFAAVERAAPDLTHVTLLQGTKAYGVHVRPIAIPAREDRDEVREEPNFYWLQEEFLKERQRHGNWHWTILRPQIIFGKSFGSPMNLIPAIGTYAALLKEDGLPLFYPGGTPSPNEAVDADLLARAIAWAGHAPAAIDQVFNITNGDVFLWRSVWPAIAEALGMQAGGDTPISLSLEMPKRAKDWERIRTQYQLASPGLVDFVGLSFQYANSCLGYGDEPPWRSGPAFNGQDSTGGVSRVHRYRGHAAKMAPHFPGKAVPATGLTCSPR